MRVLKSLGPAIIVASVVLGPGSILTSSKVGCQYGYQMVWVLVAAVILMIGMTTVSAYLGACSQRSLCDQLADRWGRPLAVAVGVLVFVIIACFQSSNNAAVLAVIEGMWESAKPSHSGKLPDDEGTSLWIKLAVLAALNGFLVATLFGFKRLYRPLERFMMLLVLAMLLAFGANLIAARPAWGATLSGLLPNLPSTEDAGTASLLPLLALVATTYSVAGAFYQSYLVREKGWDDQQLRLGLWDSIAGISILGAVSLMIMLTSAAALHGKVPVEELRSVNDVAQQLQPLFGSAAATLFQWGLFAAALSSFLGNALIGGTILSDGLGWGAKMEQAGPRGCTVAALLLGLAIASYTAIAGSNAVNVIILAQALTVLGMPLLAVLLVVMGWRAKKAGKPIPTSMLWVATLGTAVSFVLAGRTILLLWPSGG